MNDLVRIDGPRASATISLVGAELQSLQDESGRDLLWSGDALFWSGRAPLLFPIVGALNTNTLRVDGEEFEMGRHGFARKKQFAVIERDAHRVLLRLNDDATTRRQYPFAFALDVAFAATDAGISVTATVRNPAETTLPASFGFHPAFCWPLPWAGKREDHRLLFPQNEEAPIRALDAAGLIKPDRLASPIDGRLLAPIDGLFADDALIFDALASRSVRFGVPGQRMIEVLFPDMPLLGVWTKPGAPFLCIEPWHGLADPVGFVGDFREKPWVVEVPGDGSHRFAMEIRLLDAANGSR
jgi:galactose mutarotase-like enzyme